jgi:outer membrane protein assembly factor BamB
MNFFQVLVWNWGSRVGPLLILAGFGLGLIYLGIKVLNRSSRLDGSPARARRWGYGLLVPGLLLLGFAGLVIWMRPQAFEQLLQRDFDDPAKLAQLQKASLQSPDQAATGDWPQWRGPHRDGISAETGLRTNWSETRPAVVWKQPLASGYSSIAVAGGRLYTQDKQGNEERVVCLDAATGKELWVYRYPVDYSRFLSHATGPRATPTVHDNRVYTIGGTGQFLCLEAGPATSQAKVLWQHDLVQEFNARLPEWGVACSPLIEGDFVCVQPGGSKGSVAAFDRCTGELRWKALSDGSGYSSPVAATAAGVRQVICFTGKGLAGLRAENGDELWYYRWTTQYDANIATPLVAGDYVFISSGYNAGCALIELFANGYRRVGAEPVYVKHNKLMRNHHSSCVLHDGFLYGFDVGLGVLKCVDLRTAEEKWMTRDLAKGSVLLADEHLIVLSENGSLALVEATPKGYHAKGKIEDVLQGSECWALPALASGRLYLRDHHQMVCLDLRK